MALFTNSTRKSTLMPWLLLGLFFIVIIGLRNEVGCDWYNYVRHFQNTEGVSFSQAFNQIKDPAHIFVNWWMGQWGWGVYGVNLIYAIIFVIGLITFARTQTYPWLTMVAAVPYMVVMVSMGYSRQGVALGLFMLAITYVEKGKFKSYVFWVLMATMFHKTAIVLLPFGLFLSHSGMWLRVVIMIPVLYGGWDLMLAEKQEQLWNTYVEQKMQSSGAYIRVFMNFLPAILLLNYRKQWKKDYADYPFWFWIAIGSIVSMFLVGSATTAVDRITLYFIPIQLAVYSRLPYLARNRISPKMTKLMIIIGYTAVLLTWLVFASHAHCWLPYKNIMFESIF
jgi:hypothetical protein